MDNTKIGNKEAIALLVTITFNHVIFNGIKTIINTTSSASLLNILYVGILSIIFTCVMCYFLNKFPTFDIIDISNYLGGKKLKWIIGLLYIAYFIFFTGVLLHIFASSLQIIYFPVTKNFYIVLLFVITTFFACNMKYNAVYRSNLLFFPFLIISTLFLAFSDIPFFRIERMYPFLGYGFFPTFISGFLIISTLFLAFSDIPFFRIERMYPFLGYGFFPTFISGISNMFAFQALAYIYFMPPMLKEPNKIKKVAVTAIIISCIFILICVGIILFMFNSFLNTDELMPLYSAVKYIEFGSFFRKMDSFFILIWIISFISFLSITLKISSNILKKLTNVEKDSFLIFILSIFLLVASIWQKNYAISIFIVENIYRYAFFILVIGISFLVLLFAFIKQKVLRWFK